MIAMIGTSDRLCWLAETCKILLLLLLSSWRYSIPLLVISLLVDFLSACGTEAS